MKNLSSLALKKIKLHQQYLSGYPAGIRADFSQHNFCGANLSGINLRNSIMRNVDFSGASLINVDFSGSEMSGCDFSGANLLNADLSRSNLKMSDFESADLSATMLNEAGLKCAYFIDSILENTDFSGADLFAADFSGAIINNAKFDTEIEDGLLQRIAKIIINNPKKFNSENTHTDKNVHDLAGWACHLAERGEEMEEQYGWAWAGLRLLGPEAATHFYDSDQNAIAWLRGVVR